MRDKWWIVQFFILLAAMQLDGQRISSGFEVRYFSNDSAANGETDFKGETSVFSTEDRLEFLKYYGKSAAVYFQDEGLDTEVVTDQEAEEQLSQIRPQPLPRVREKILLEEWKILNHKPGQHEASVRRLNQYKGGKGLNIREGTLHFSDHGHWKWDFENQTWRFFFEWSFQLKEDAEGEFRLGNNTSGGAMSRIVVKDGKLIFNTEPDADDEIYIGSDQTCTIRMEVDLTEDEPRYFNLYLNGEFLKEIRIQDGNFRQINYFEVNEASGVSLYHLYGVGYHPVNQPSYPYYPRTFIDIRYDLHPDIRGWENEYYDDSRWKTSALPVSLGSERHEGEDLYLRKYVKTDDFQRAFLNIETLDPGGEIWINGRMVALIRDRYPVRIDVTDHLKPDFENLIAVKVNHFYLNPGEGVASPHTMLDNNPGWFAGRAWLDLTDETLVEDVFFYTSSLEREQAEIYTNVKIRHTGTLGFKGKVMIRMVPWGQEEEGFEKMIEKEVLVPSGVESFPMTFHIKNPLLWTPESPGLYLVEVTLIDDRGNEIDDYIFTSGVRTLSQKNGQFHLNGKPAMLNGTQIMGFRSPLENTMAWLRCPPDEWVVKELMQTQRMNCNMLRIHVHGWKETAVGINDPRYAEMADQMGIMLIATTPAWIREGDWGQVDFEGYHKYMRSVQNHPSVVMWEISNHPNTFNKNPDYESDLFIKTAYESVYPYDPSRLISFTSHIAHMKYGNDAGTIDKGGRNLNLPADKDFKDPGDQMQWNQELFEDHKTGERIDSFYAWTAPMVTRGNQDAPTGYGKEWSELRKWPNSYTRDFLESKERAYFNFEHQESIGQPNWKMSRGKPWYLLQSYEWNYDKGSIGRRLTADEWLESQAWQAFSAYEATKKMRWLDYDGFSWCSLHGGANSVTYKKPAIDFLGYGKLVFHIHKIIFQPVLAGSKNVDVVYGPEDVITPIILNLGEEKTVKLTIQIRDQPGGEIVDEIVYQDVLLEEGRTVIELNEYRPEVDREGLYFIEYLVDL